MILVNVFLSDFFLLFPRVNTHIERSQENSVYYFSSRYLKYEIAHFDLKRAFVNIRDQDTVCHESDAFENIARMEAKTRVFGCDKESKEFRIVKTTDRILSARACLRTFGGTLRGAPRFGEPREVSGRCRRWFRESRVWVTRWRVDNARNFGFEFCATIVTARHAPRPLLDVVPRVAMTFGFDRVVVRVVGYLYHLLPGLGSDLCCARHRQRCRISPPIRPGFVISMVSYISFFNIFVAASHLQTCATHVWRCSIPSFE